MGDCDLRLRWCAAHAVRSLARTGETKTLRKLADEYHRREDSAYRGESAFYWLAARLWFAITWDRIASEAPAVASQFSRTILGIALDDTFPHLLVRSFSRDACEKLVAAGQLSLRTDTTARLNVVNESPLPRQPVNRTLMPRRSHWGLQEGFRFRFDGIDTLPYWYEPMLRSFANLDMENFLTEVEHWIIDTWGYGVDRFRSGEMGPLGRFNGADRGLDRHRHGSIPTVEPLHTHLEWHAMWCAAGGLLKTHALPSRAEDGSVGYLWEDLDRLIRRNKPAGSPLWSADLRGPIPLQRRNWLGPSDKSEDWISHVPEPYFRGEILPEDTPEHLAVNGSFERSYKMFRETISVSSALVDPNTGGSLLRALQTMEDSWDYILPPEGDDQEIEQAPFELVGWLEDSWRDESFDDKDPLRASVLAVRCRPGKRVTSVCGLRSNELGRLCWFKSDADEPMFIFESWGGPKPDDYRYANASHIAGDRLLVRKDELLAFLSGQDWDLVIEVEVTRRGRETRRYLDTESDEEPEGRFARLYRLDRRGGLEVAEGRLGTWTDDCP